MYNKIFSVNNKRGGNMTEKELLYLEDAISHEKSIISLCNDFVLNVENSHKEFFNNQITSHNELLNNLMTLLKEKTNE